METRQVNPQNERLKREFRVYLTNRKRCPATIRCYDRALLDYEKFVNYQDFKRLRTEMIQSYKKYLGQKIFSGRKVAITTYCNYLRFIKEFFEWLSNKNGFKKSVTIDKVAFFNPTNKEMSAATQPIPRDYPQLEHIIKLAKSITVNTEIDLRDRALVSFTLVSGIRADAVTSLSLKCFDETDLYIIQNPRDTTRTKYSKLIGTRLVGVSKELLEYFLEWFNHLKGKGYTANAPLFPRSKIIQDQHKSCFAKSYEVEPVFWHSAGRMRAIFKTRSSNAGLKYYDPHSYRHLAAALTIRACKNFEEMKAVSQNFGHRFIATTLGIYGNLSRPRQCQLIAGLDYTYKQKSNSEKLDELMIMLKNNIANKSESL